MAKISVVMKVNVLINAAPVKHAVQRMNVVMAPAVRKASVAKIINVFQRNAERHVNAMRMSAASIISVSTALVIHAVKREKHVAVDYNVAVQKNAVIQIRVSVKRNVRMGTVVTRLTRVVTV